MNNKEILKNIKITEESILSLFKENTTIELTKLLDQSLSNNIKIVLQELPLLVINPDTIDILNNIILDRIRNLCRKRYITEIKFKSNNDETLLNCYSKLDLIDIGNITDNEVVLRAGRDKTILYYNDKEENDVIEISIKTEAKLNKDSFLNVDILDFTHTDYKYYNVYKVIFIIQPFTKLELTTDKNHKCFQSVDIKDPYTELYKYYGMKIFINSKKLIKIYDKNKDKQGIQHNLSISNLHHSQNRITIFLDVINKDNIIHENLSLPMFSNTELNIITDKNLFAYLSDHGKCIIFNNGKTVYEY